MKGSEQEVRVGCIEDVMGSGGRFLDGQNVR